MKTTTTFDPKIEETYWRENYSKQPYASGSTYDDYGPAYRYGWESYSRYPGRRYEEPSIGRVVVAPEARGRALGRALMQEGIARCRAAWPGRGIRISAQARLERFYRSLGFELVGAEYLEDGIPHIEMLRSFP